LSADVIMLKPAQSFMLIPDFFRQIAVRAQGRSCLKNRHFQKLLNVFNMCWWPCNIWC